MKTIAVMGLGLMGSSLGLALKKRGVPVKVHAYARRAETRDAALALGAADAVFSDPWEAVRGADLVVFCVPILTIPELAKACLSGLKPGAILTDVGSTKAELAVAMDNLLVGTDAVFVGSHPICGSEQQGIDAGDAELYEGAVTVVTPKADADEEKVAEVSNLWKSVGSVVKEMTTEEHDWVLARTSHLPHVVAVALVLTLGGVNEFCGTGFKDTTRIASGSPEVWKDIFISNNAQVLGAIDDFKHVLDEFSELIKANDLERLEVWLRGAAVWRKELLG